MNRIRAIGRRIALLAAWSPFWWRAPGPSGVRRSIPVRQRGAGAARQRPPRPPMPSAAACPAGKWP